MVHSSKVIALVWALAVPSFALQSGKLTENQKKFSDFVAARPSKKVVQASGPLKSGDTIYLRNPSHGNQYVECRGGQEEGDIRISTTSNRYNRHNDIPTAQFTLKKQGGEGEIQDGDVIFLQNPSHNDLHVMVKGEAGHGHGIGGVWGPTESPDVFFTIHRWDMATGTIMSGDAIYLRIPSRANEYLECHGAGGNGYAISTNPNWNQFYHRVASSQFTIHEWNAVSEISLGSSELVEQEGVLLKFKHILGEGIVDMEVTNTTPYTADNGDATGVDGDFGRINMKCGTSTEFKFSFKSAINGQPITMDKFHFTFADLDQGEDGHCRESIMISGFDDYVLSANSGLEVTQQTEDDTAYTVFTASALGDGEDNPQSVSLDDEQSSRAVSLKFTDTQSFTIRYVTGGEGYAGRLLYFAGPTSISLDSKLATLRESDEVRQSRNVDCYDCAI